MTWMSKINEISRTICIINWLIFSAVISWNAVTSDEFAIEKLLSVDLYGAMDED